MSVTNIQCLTEIKDQVPLGPQLYKWKWYFFYKNDITEDIFVFQLKICNKLCQHLAAETLTSVKKTFRMHLEATDTVMNVRSIDHLTIDYKN